VERVEGNNGSDSRSNTETELIEFTLLRLLLNLSFEPFLFPASLCVFDFDCEFEFSLCDDGLLWLGRVGDKTDNSSS
jgi:hypothetical protein